MTTTTRRIEVLFKREKPGTGIPPKWLEHIWEVGKAAKVAGRPNPFDSRPKLADAPGGWTEDYPTGGKVVGTATIVTVSYPEPEAS